jgi:hypothetical protein
MITTTTGETTASEKPRTRQRGDLLVVSTWAATRLLLAAYAFKIISYGGNYSAIVGDVKLYDTWSHILDQGNFPYSDWHWQYPPGAAVVFLLPKLLANKVFGFGYVHTFLALALLVDLATFVLLFVAGRRLASRGTAWHERAGAWAWVWGIFAIGPVALGRYDVFATFIAVAALTVAAITYREPLGAWARGLLTGFGTIVKVWPVAVLIGEPRGAEGRRSIKGALVGAVVPTLLFLVTMNGALSFLKYQNARGLEIESVPAMPFVLLRWFGVHAYSRQLRYGSYEIVGPGVYPIAQLMLPVTALGILLLLWWRRRYDHWTAATTADFALASVLVYMVTYRVLSPQYLVWLVGLAAVCLMYRDTTQRRACFILLAMLSMSQLEYPYYFQELVYGGTKAVLVLFVRNALLLLATWYSLRAIYRGGDAETPRPLPRPATLLSSLRRSR